MTQLFDSRGLEHNPFLRDLFYCWHKILRRYEHAIPGDLAYNYGERTNVGLIAAAATKKRCLVLEDFSCEKEAKHKRYLGRGDLWIREPNRERDYHFEAKATIPNLDKKDVTREVTRSLREACDDAKNALAGYGHRPQRSAGIVFVIPHVPPRGKPDFDPNEFIAEILNLRSLNASFSVVHMCAREVKDLEQGRPCIAVVGKYVEYPLTKSIRRVA
jgi:hypothetical protein